MQIYFIRFSNTFETKWFMDNKESLFMDILPVIIIHNHLFVEFVVREGHYFSSVILFKQFPSIRITKKTIHKGKSRYVKL